MNNHEIKKIVLCGFGMAVIFVLTAFVAIPIGQFGYVNLGDTGVMLFASILNPALAFLVGGVGSAAADMFLGFTQYALFTFVIKGLEALLIAIVAKKIKGNLRAFGYLLGLIVMVLGYYLADSLLFGYITALGGVGFNFMQGVICCIIASVAQIFFVNTAQKYFVE